MSTITYAEDGKHVIKRQGEFYEVNSCYKTPRSVHAITDGAPEWNDPVFAALQLDVNELMNKPRRFFDHLLSVIEYQRDNDVDIDKSNHREYWQNMVKGCELWLSAVNNGLYVEAMKLSQPVKEYKKRT